ncbi:hypothetical protein Gpo141_00007182 [Globisporangium polare]
MSASYNDWESDLSSIIEKTNQNLKLLRRIGEKRTDDVTTTRPTATSVGNAADLRTAVHHRYAAEDAAASGYRPRVMSSASGVSNRKLASTMGDPRGATGLRASAMMDARRGEANYDSDDLHAASRSMRRSASRAGDSSKTLKATSSMGATIRVHEADMPSDVPNYVLDEIKKSLEVNISSRSSVFEKKIGDLRTDFTVLTNETTQLSHKFAELRDSVLSKMSNVPGVLQSLQENADAITRLEKHSAALLGWKVSMDQDFFEITAKVKSFTTLQDKMATLESNLESLATALKNRPRHDEKIEELRDKLSAVERHQSSLVDMKAVENLLNIRLPRELHDLEGRMSQSIAFVTEKVEAKIQNLEKSLQSQRADSMASLKSELVEDIQRLQVSSLRKTDIVPLQNAHAQLKEDLSQLNGYLDRQDKRIQDFKQSSTQIREELAETKQELTKTLHAQQSRVAATLEDKVAQLSILSKEKNVKVDQQMAILSKKQKKVEENTKVLHEDIAKVRQDVLYKQNATHVAQQKENEKLRQRLARSAAELETLTFAKAELERRYGKQEKQFQAKLKTLHAKLEENEKLKESERLELVEKIQEETKLMGIAQGKNTLLETLLAKEKLENTEKNELIHKSRQEMNLIRQKMRSLENEVELKMHKLTIELHSKQVQVETLVKKLKKSEEEAAKLLENTRRDAKAFRRAKITKEHELSIAKLKLNEMEKAASAISQSSGVKEDSSGVPDATKRDAEEAESKRKEMEQLLLESQLQVDELNQEISEMQKQHGAATKQQRASLEEQISKLSSEYEVKIVALNAAVAAKDQAMSRLRESLVEKRDLEAVDEQLRALADEKKSLLATIERSHSEQTRAIQEHEAKTQLAHDKEIAAMKRNVATRVEEIEEARAGLERFKANISRLETQLKDQESSHSEELESLMDDIKKTRASIAACTTEFEELRVEKSQLEQELESVQAELENLRSEADDREMEMSKKLAEQETEMQSKLDELSSQLDDKESELAESKRADVGNRRKLSEMVSEQEEMEHRLKSEIESLTLALDHERENSKAREQESESTILVLQSELDVIKLDSQAAKTSYQSAMSSEIADVTSSLKESQRREQQLQGRLVSILKEVAQAASAFNADSQVDITGSEDDDAVAVKYLSHFCATQSGTLLELENLQTDYEMAVKQTAEDAATIQDLDAQAKAHSLQIQDLQAVVKQLEVELKEQYASSAKQSEDLEHEITMLKKQKSELERLVDSKSSECDEKQALFDCQLESKQDQVEGLRQENEKMSATIETIRSKMDRIEVAKARELDEMSATLSELEAQTATHSVKAQDGAVPEFDKDLYANHHEIVALSQSIRSLQLKLTKSVGLLEWNDLRASVFEQEDKLERLRQEKYREVAKLGSAEDEILLNTDFLKAVLALKGSSKGDGDDRSDWMSKYVKTAPEMVERLRGLESRLQEAMEQRIHQASADETGSAAHEANALTGNKTPATLASQSSKSRVDLSESCESDELLEESHEYLDRAHQFDAEQSFDGSLDESDLSDSAILNESSLDVSTADDATEELSICAMNEALSYTDDDGRLSTSNDFERVASCTTLLLASTPPELLSTPFVASPTRHSAQVSTAPTAQSRDGSKAKSSTRDESDDDSSEEESEDDKRATAELPKSESALEATEHVADSLVASVYGRVLQTDARELSSAPSAADADLHAVSVLENGIEETSVGAKHDGDDLHDEASEAEHSLDSSASVERGGSHDDAAFTSLAQQFSSESSTTPHSASNSESVPALAMVTGDQYDGDKSRAHADVDDEDEDRAIDSEEEAEVSQDEKSFLEVAVRADSQKLSDESLKSAPASDEHDDLAEDETHGEESADLEDQSLEFDSADFDSGVKDKFQLAHKVEHDQGFQHVDSENEESEGEDEDSKAHESAIDHNGEDEFESGAQDRGSLRDVGFESHESDEENLSEFEHFRRETAASSADSMPESNVSSHADEEHQIAPSQTYHMEEDDDSDDDDVDEAERMLLADSLVTEQQLNSLSQFGNGARLEESSDQDDLEESVGADEQLDESVECERDNIAVASFDKDADSPLSAAPVSNPVLDNEVFPHNSTLESRARKFSADGSEQSDTVTALHDDTHRDSSHDFDDEDDDLLDESHEGNAAHSVLRELVKGSGVTGSAEAHLNLDESTGGDGENASDIPAQNIDAVRAAQNKEQMMDDRLGERSEEENSRSDINEGFGDEDQSESSFDQVPTSSSLGETRTDLAGAQEVAVDSSSTTSSATSGSLGGRSALLKHMSFSRTQIENDDDDDDLDEVEQLIREQSGFASHTSRALPSLTVSREARDEEAEVDEEERDDELIDSESEEDEPPFDASCDEGGMHFDVAPRSEADGSPRDGALSEDLNATQQEAQLADSHEKAQLRLDASQDDADDVETDGQEASLEASQEELDTDATSGRSTFDREMLERSFDEQLLKTLETEHEDSTHHFDGGAISESESENGDEQQDGSDGDSVDGELTPPADQQDSMQTSARVHVKGRHDIIHPTKSEDSARLGQDDNSDDDDEFEFGSRRTEPSLPSAPIKLQTSQLASIGQSSSRLSGAGALKKALSAVTRDFDDEDDDVDEAERLMAEQSLSRTSKPVASTAPSASFGKSHLGDSEDEDEFGSETSHKTRPADRRDESDDFEEHELDVSARDDHDESFESVEASNDFKKTDAARDDGESDDEDIDGHRESPQKPSSASTKPADILEKKPLRFGLGRRVSLEEDDDMDEVERLLLEQTSMKQTGPHQVERITGARSSVFDGDDDGDDDEFGEASIRKLMDADALSSSAKITASAVAQDLSAHHERSLDESSGGDDDVEDEQEESLDASQQESSVDAASVGQFAASASRESSFDEKSSKNQNKAVRADREDPGNRATGGAISDSSDSDDDGERSTSHLSRSPATTASSVPAYSLAPLGLGQKTLGLGLGGRAALEEDEDMDEVERLLLGQSSRKQQNVTSHATQATMHHEDADESNDDEFGEESIGALMDERDPIQQPRPQATSHLKPIDVVEKPQQQGRRSVFADEDDVDGGDIDTESDLATSSPLRRRGDLDRSDSAASSPSASSTRIPIFNGSNLADRVATDAIPTMLSQQSPQQPATATAAAVESEIQQQVEHEESEKDEEEEEEEYLEKSFDLEESLQGDDEED